MTIGPVYNRLPRDTFREAILYVLAQAGEPLTTAQIRAELSGYGLDPGRTLSDTLARLSQMRGKPPVVRLGKPNTRCFWALADDPAIRARLKGYPRPFVAPPPEISRRSPKERTIYLTAKAAPAGYWLWRCDVCLPRRSGDATAFCTKDLPAPRCPDCGSTTSRTSTHTWGGRVEEIAGRCENG